jgi:hypothetical protein
LVPIKTQDMPEHVLGRAHDAWAEREPPRWHLTVATEACDAPGAVERARQRFDDHIQHMHGKKAVVDQNVVLVDDPGQRPASAVSALPLPIRYRYPTRDWKHRPYADLATAAACDHRLLRISPVLTAAIEQVRAGGVSEAFAMLVPILSTLFEECSSRFGEFNRSADLGSYLLAVASVHGRFEHMATYLTASTWQLSNRSLVSNATTRKRVYRILGSDNDWARVIRKTPWDSLLGYRRAAHLREARKLHDHLSHWRTIYEADLTRVVRARHDFAHRGHPTDDPYLVAVLIELTKAVLELRIDAALAGIRFETLMDALVESINRQTLATNGHFMLAAEGDLSIGLLRRLARSSRPAA